MWKKKKVRAGVLLYAVTIAGIFSLLLQFYLNRQVAHHQDYALNKEKLLAFAMAKRTYEKASSESGVQSFDVGKATYHTDEKGFLKIVTSGKNQFEFRFSPLKKLLLFLFLSGSLPKKEFAPTFLPDNRENRVRSPKFYYSLRKVESPDADPKQNTLSPFPNFQFSSL